MRNTKNDKRASRRSELPCSQLVQVRGKYPVYDADARPIHVGDTLEWEATSGPYGQTKRGRGVVTSSDLICGCIVTDGGQVNTHWEWKPADGPEGLYCRHENHTYDHRHKTWARVVSSVNSAITFSPDGSCECLYTEAIDLAKLGDLSVRRATDIAFDDTSQLWVVRDTEGREQYRHASREACLDWERIHLQKMEDEKHGGLT
jgi:hypothetical protein